VDEAACSCGRGRQLTGQGSCITGRVVAVCLSDRKGIPKQDQKQGMLVSGHGLMNDSHAGGWHRQISLLATSSIDKMRAKGLELAYGDFAENLTIEGIDLWKLAVGTRLIISDSDGPIIEVTQIGKECHHGCAIFQQVGECIMPTEGIFARVVRGGQVEAGDSINQFSEDKWLAAIVTASDKGSRGEREDVSGKVIAQMVEEAGGLVVSSRVLPDEQSELARYLVHLSDEVGVDVVFTTGGTGLGPRDVTPEATRSVISKEVPGIAEAMRLAGLKKTPHAMLSRQVAGTRALTLFINLPGSPRGVSECLEPVLPAIRHAVEILRSKVSECATP